LAQPTSHAAPAGGDDEDALYESDPAEAFANALKLWESGDFATALPIFQQAVDASGSPNARLYVARCLRDLGKLPEAYDQMRLTLQDALKMAQDEARYAQTRNTAAAELALLEARVARLVVVLDPAVAGAQVTVNDAPLPSERVGQPMAVHPGRVSVIARKPDGTSVQRVEDAAAGAMLTITLGAPTSAPPPTAPPPVSAPAAPDDDSEFGMVRAIGIGVAAVGVAGLVTFAVTRAQADAEIRTLEDECGAGPCTDPQYADVVDRGKTAETIAGVGLGIGIAGVLAGTAMIIFGGPGEDDAQQGWSPAPGGFGLHF
jgi:hypothetical protein